MKTKLVKMHKAVIMVGLADNNGKQTIDHNDVQELASQYIKDGFSYQESIGRYDNYVEQSVSITVLHENKKRLVAMVKTFIEACILIFNKDSVQVDISKTRITLYSK